MKSDQTENAKRPATHRDYLDQIDAVQEQIAGLYREIENIKRDWTEAMAPSKPGDKVTIPPGWRWSGYEATVQAVTPVHVPAPPHLWLWQVTVRPDTYERETHYHLTLDGQPA